MEGQVKRIYRDLRYGFIKSTDGGLDYFFHKDDFDGDWHALCTEFDNNNTADVEFEPTNTDKGLRAKEVVLA